MTISKKLTAVVLTTKLKTIKRKYTQNREILAIERAPWPQLLVKANMEKCTKI